MHEVTHPILPSRANRPGPSIVAWGALHSAMHFEAREKESKPENILVLLATGAASASPVCRRGRVEQVKPGQRSPSPPTPGQAMAVSEISLARAAVNMSTSTLSTESIL
jgi:hypothetical protein